jgi:hypothetical protein
MHECKFKHFITVPTLNNEVSFCFIINPNLASFLSHVSAAPYHCVWQCKQFAKSAEYNNLPLLQQQVVAQVFEIEIEVSRTEITARSSDTNRK